MKTTGSRGRQGAQERDLGEALEFMRLLWALAHSLQKRSKQMEAVLGVTGPQRFVIRIVGRFPGITAGRLARILHVHPSTLTGILRRLQQKGLVSRRADSRDRRRALLGLTARGRALDARAAGGIDEVVRATLAELPDARVQVAAQVLAALASSVARPLRSGGGPDIERLAG